MSFRRSRRRTGVAGAAVAVAALAGAAVLSGCTNSTGGAGNIGYVPAESSGISVVDAAHRSAAPDLSGTTLDGKHLALTDYRGKYVVVNVWGSWCTPCRVESPGLEEAYQKYQGKNVAFVGLNTHDDNAAALAFAAADKITYPSLQDPDETLLLQFKSVLPPTSIPSTIIVDPNGKVAVRIIGAVTEPQLAQTLDQLLGGH